MAVIQSNRRPPFAHRPYITGGLYDTLNNSNVLHMDAYLLSIGSDLYLYVDCKARGVVSVAESAYLLRGREVSEVWDAARVCALGVQEYWSRANHEHATRAHLHVLDAAERFKALGRYTRVSVLAHYVNVSESDPEAGLGAATPAGAGTPDAAPVTLGEALAGGRTLGRRRGRPPKSVLAKVAPWAGVQPDLI
jgi:hypothetical protein